MEIRDLGSNHFLPRSGPDRALPTILTYLACGIVIILLLVTLAILF